jgi:hypothetical protein
VISINFSPKLNQPCKSSKFNRGCKAKCDAKKTTLLLFSFDHFLLFKILCSHFVVALINNFICIRQIQAKNSVKILLMEDDKFHLELDPVADMEVISLDVNPGTPVNDPEVAHRAARIMTQAIGEADLTPVQTQDAKIIPFRPRED